MESILFDCMALPTKTIKIKTPLYVRHYNLYKKIHRSLYIKNKNQPYASNFFHLILYLFIIFICTSIIHDRSRCELNSESFIIPLNRTAEWLSRDYRTDKKSRLQVCEIITKNMFPFQRTYINTCAYVNACVSNNGRYVRNWHRYLVVDHLTNRLCNILLEPN